MRISPNTSIETAVNSSNSINASNKSVELVVEQGRESNNTSSVTNADQGLFEINDETSSRLQEAVTKMNDMLEVNNSTSKFMYHEGLNRYYVTVVNKETDEVVREIPPKKLLDAFYEMQKMLGMIVDEKI